MPVDNTGSLYGEAPEAVMGPSPVPRGSVLLHVAVPAWVR